MTPVTHALTAALIHFVWQGIVVAFLLWITLFLLRKHSANARYAAGCIALGALALAPLMTGLMTGWMVYQPELQVSELSGVRSLGQSVSLLLSGGGSVAPAVTESLKRMDAWILPLWVIGVLIFALRFAWASGHASSLRRHGKEVDAAILSLVESLAERSGVKARIRVLMSTVAEMPSVVGWMRPVVLLPAAVVVGLTPQQLEAVIAHELAHIRRQDYLVNILQTIVETLLFYHPAVWWVSSRIRYEREICCDDRAVEVCGDAVCYARALAHIEKLRVFTPSLAMGSAKGPLFHRIQRLLTGEGRQPAPSRWASAVGLLAVVFCLGFNLTWASSVRRGEFTSLPQVPALPPLAVQAQPVLALPPLAVALPLPISAVAPLAPLPASPAARQAADLRDLFEHELAQARWVLLRGGLVIVHGTPSDEAAAKAVQGTTPGDLLWFQLEGKTYVTQDKATLDRFQALAGENPLNLIAPQTAVGGLAIQLDKLRAAAEESRLRSFEAQNDLLNLKRLLDEKLVSRQVDSREFEAKLAEMEKQQKLFEKILVEARQRPNEVGLQAEAQDVRARIAEAEEELRRAQKLLQTEQLEVLRSKDELNLQLELKARLIEIQNQVQAMEKSIRAGQVEALRRQEELNVLDGQIRQLLREAVRSGNAQPR